MTPSSQTQGLAKEMLSRVGTEAQKKTFITALVQQDTPEGTHCLPEGEGDVRFVCVCYQFTASRLQIQPCCRLQGSGAGPRASFLPTRWSVFQSSYGFCLPTTYISQTYC